MTDGHETTLTGKVAIVTGAGSGVGQATALALTVAGAIPVLVGRTPGPLAATAAAISMAGGRSLVAAADVADEAAVERLVERAVAELGGVDLLVAAAGIGRFGLVVGYALADWQATLATNLTGVFLCARAAVPAMQARGGGAIVAIGSGAGKQGDAAGLVEHAEEAKKHAIMAQKDFSSFNLQNAAKQLDEAITAGKQGDAKVGTTHAEEAVKVLASGAPQDPNQP